MAEKHKNITIIGTSHISAESIKTIEKAITANKPGIVAVELDRKRFDALTSKKPKSSFFLLIRKIGLTGVLFAVIGAYIQKKLGRLAGIEPGADMLAAIKSAKKNGIPVYLIDRDIEVTLARFSMNFSWKEKLRLLKDIFLAIFFQKGQMRKYGIDKIDLSKVPPKQVIERMIKQIKKHYPSIYNVLIEERDSHMAKALLKIAAENEGKKILAVVGAGHEEGMMRIVKQDTYFRVHKLYK